MSPIYDFVCTNKKCKHTFEEIFLTLDEDTSKIKCPKCKKKAKKVPSINACMKANWSMWSAMLHKD